MSKVYLEPCQQSKMKLFAKIINGLKPKPLIIFKKSFTLDVCEGSEYTSSCA